MTRLESSDHLGTNQRDERVISFLLNEQRLFEIERENTRMFCDTKE